MSGVSVRPRPRLPRRPSRAPSSGRRRGLRPILPGRCRSPTTPAPKSTVVLEIELPPERLDRAIGDAVRHLSRRTRVPGFRPGKAPRPVLERALGPGAVLDEAVEHLVQDAYREALVEQDILPLTNADVEVVQAEEGKPLVFKATVQVRPEVDARRLQAASTSRPRSRPIDDARVDQVVEELRDQNATLAAVEDRGAKDGDYAVIALRRARATARRSRAARSERMPLILGQERLIPGFEAQPRRARGRASSTEFDITFPDDYGEPELAGQPAHFAVDLKELREKVLPDARRRLRRSRSATSPTSPRCGPTSSARLERQRARPGPPRVRRQDHRVRRRQRDRSSCPTSSSTRRSR